MRTVEVTAPGGTRWEVRVVWEPRWRVMARRFGGWRAKRRKDIGPGDALSGGAEVSSEVSSSGGNFNDEFVIIAIVFFAFVLAAVLFWWVLLPLLLIVLDALIILILLAASMVARVLFRRPWIVRATSATGETTEVEVVGWRAALRRRDAMADELRQPR
ncbi:hypothetical protein [Paractinoplanes atraurantiacus]|uniref:Uncharacterized protein n=1 Tax=Paractinoplanes atraurantiacus TaxID=1036182 RepID=A0A285GJU7_9ACTN|nr:hypothetical protein [Actinoplanes atraurantiacus]SNY23484.1 hypothetical protein SAMN05421748_10248 [Actinoplanes atraurantiacus]